MSNWELLVALNKACTESQRELSRVILETDFKDNGQAQEFVLDVFLITDENIINNMEAAIKISNFDIMSLPWKEAYRLQHIRSRLEIIGDENGL